MSVGIIACGKNKLNYPAQAQDMYIGELFKKSRKYVEKTHDRWFIASAKYCFLEPNMLIKPYEKTLNNMTKNEVQTWSHFMAIDIASNVKKQEEIYIYAGDKYRRYLIPKLVDLGYTVHVPMKGLGIGQQLKWLKERIL
jgi:hypothetical protein